ncbi:hypothetical protein F8M41_024667 [Gigaspora margarita]|uniref:Uncharacterized protein n=1 Tax=Gigaspora margarita TaxID=4874 RepID=A0A8H4ETA4_GIGMA|nr:hypothetical protein F8M41_024667 [Gigaspora margarita]
MEYQVLQNVIRMEMAKKKIDHDKSSKKFDKDDDSNTSSENDNKIDEIKPADNDEISVMNREKNCNQLIISYGRLVD